MDDVRLELGEVALGRTRKRDRQPIFRSTGNWNGRDADDISRCRKRRLIDGWRIDADVNPLPEQVANKAVERLVGPIAHVIVIARDEGDAKVGRLHGPAL